MANTAHAQGLLPIDDALAAVLAAVTPLESEELALVDAAGRFLAEPLLAAIALPPFTNSAMDGYAIRAADAPGTLAVIGESAAGIPFGGTVGSGEAVAISTGAVLPDGADAVVPIENVLADEAGGRRVVRIAEPVASGLSIRRMGGDSPRGAEILPAGVRLGPAQIGAAAAVGIARVRCGRLPTVAILTTGSELRSAGQELGPGEIYDANGPMLTAALRGAGARVTRVPSASDTEAAHRAALEQALEHDVVISSGGVSVGPHDLVRGIGAELGVQERFWRVKMRPGKPVSFGVRERTLVFGLPGNPVSTLVGFELFVRPALQALQGAATPEPAFERGTLAVAVRQNPQRDDLIRVRRDEDGTLEPIAGQESHQIAFTAQAHGLARIPTGEGELAAGSPVAYLPVHTS